MGESTEDNLEQRVSSIAASLKTGITMERYGLDVCIVSEDVAITTSSVQHKEAMCRAADQGIRYCNFKSPDESVLMREDGGSNPMVYN